MNNNSLKLASKFLREVKSFPDNDTGKIDCSVQYKNEVLKDVSEILTGKSVSYVQLVGLFDKTKDLENRESFYKPCDILEHYKIPFKRGTGSDPANLISINRFYYHPRLQLVPPAPKLKIDDDGTITSSYDSEEFFLEMIDSFTLRDLVDYFYSKTNSFVPSVNLVRDIGAFEHLLQFWDVDFILYLIDEAFAYSSDKGRPVPSSPLRIREYDEKALHVYESRKRISYEEGLDRVLPRTR